MAMYEFSWTEQHRWWTEAKDEEEAWKAYEEAKYVLFEGRETWASSGAAAVEEDK